MYTTIRSCLPFFFLCLRALLTCILRCCLCVCSQLTPSQSHIPQMSSSTSSHAALPTQSLPVAFSITLFGALLMVGGVSFLRSKGLTTPLQGRKLMHLLTGPVFVLTWLLYPTHLPEVRLLAGTIPFGVAFYMFGNARGFFRDRGLIQTISRTGSPSELEHGPFYYGLIHTLASIAYWTDTPTGVVSIIILCIGDGIADLIGRPYGRHKWFHNRDKSIEGSVAFFVASGIVLYGYITLFNTFGLFARIDQVRENTHV